jgi:hypothetical protein
LRTTQFAPKCTRFERYKSYEMAKQCQESQSVLAGCTTSRLEAAYSCDAWLFCKMKAAP